jgi:ATP/maltotriose-dependent transcriptional regulator MalT
MVGEGWAALRDGDASTARRAFEVALETAETGEAFEGLGQALYLEREYVASAERHERAYARYRTDGDAVAASRAARTAAWIRGNVLGDWAVEAGWLARARSVLEEVGGDGPQRGWALILSSHTEPDLAERERLLRAAAEIGRRTGDAHVEFEAIGYLGALFVLTGRVERGMAYLDEALAAACAGELTDLAMVESLFCGFFWACEMLHDVGRAEQWMRVAGEMIRRRTVVAAFCRAHYGGILTAAGRWPEAEAELVEAVRQFDRGPSPRRATAIMRLAELRVRQGRLEEAAELLRGLEDHPDAVRTLASLHLARGEPALARHLLERATAGSDEDVPSVGETTTVGPLLALLVDVHLDEGRVEAAASAARRLDRVAAASGGQYLPAAAALAAGRVGVAAADADALDRLRTALEGFARAQLPMEQARTRLEMARCLASASPEVAIAHARAALEGFERLEAARHADAAAATLRSLGVPARTGSRGVGGLTRREREVLALVGAGLSNPEIGERLFIARKTVEHHVGSVLSKLGLRNRAEAAAFAVREDIRR